MYFDDGTVLSEDAKQDMHQVDRVLRLVSVAGIALRLQSRFFFSNKIGHLGHIIFSGMLAVASKTAESIIGLSYRTNVSQN